MWFKNKRAANLLGCVSLSLSIIPLTYIAYPQAYRNASLAEAMVLIGGVQVHCLRHYPPGFLARDGGLWQP